MIDISDIIIIITYKGVVAGQWWEWQEHVCEADEDHQRQALQRGWVEALQVDRLQQLGAGHEG